MGMKRRCGWLALICCLALVPLGGMAGAAVADTSTKRVVTYFANWGDRLQENCDQLQEACRQGYLTHIIVGLFHLGFKDEAQTQPTIHLGQQGPSDPSLQPLWDALAEIRVKYPRVKIMASFGGADVGDYRQLLSGEFSLWYPLLKDTLTNYQFVGLDLDIEEDVDNVNTINVMNFVSQLRKDFGPGFLVTSAPVATALVVPWESMSRTYSMTPKVDYVELLNLPGLFDWYNVQFYGWGNLLHPEWYWNGPAPDYAMVVATQQLPPQKLVAGVVTAPSAGAGYYDILTLVPTFKKLVQENLGFGGVYGWHFDCAMVGENTDPVGWTKAVTGALYGHPQSSINALLLSN
jgi:hypothetical protein